MLTIFEGQISFGGMHDALEAVSKHKNIKSGVLRVTSNQASGLMGVFCGRFITGAVITLSGEVGYAALKSLLAAKDGTFAFMDATGEPLPDLQQSLAVDIQILVSSVDFASTGSFLSEQTLTGMSASMDEVKLIDTTVDYGGEAEGGNTVERIDRINQTYQRILSLSEHQRAQQAQAESQPPSPPQSQSQSPPQSQGAPQSQSQPVDPAPAQPSQQRADHHRADYEQEEQYKRMRRERSTASSELTEAVTAPASLPAVDLPESSPSTTSNDFRRLKDWSDKAAFYRLIWSLLAFVVLAAGIVYCGPMLGGYLHAFLPH